MVMSMIMSMIMSMMMMMSMFVNPTSRGGGVDGTLEEPISSVLNDEMEAR